MQVERCVEIVFVLEIKIDGGRAQFRFLSNVLGQVPVSRLHHQIPDKTCLILLHHGHGGDFVAGLEPASAIRGTRQAWRIVASVVYGSSLIALFLASTLYHAWPVSPMKRRLRLLDHCAIYLLIAGSYTPFLLVAMRNGTGWWLFGAIWTPELSGWRRSDSFEEYVRVTNLLDYWKVRGWPDLCRPDGDGIACE